MRRMLLLLAVLGLIGGAASVYSYSSSASEKAAACDVKGCDPSDCDPADCDPAKCGRCPFGNR